MKQPNVSIYGGHHHINFILMSLKKSRVSFFSFYVFYHAKDLHIMIENRGGNVWGIRRDRMLGLKRKIYFWQNLFLSSSVKGRRNWKPSKKQDNCYLELQQLVDTGGTQQ